MGLRLIRDVGCVARFLKRVIAPTVWWGMGMTFGGSSTAVAGGTWGGIDADDSGVSTLERYG
jgi:hypothetical protein